MKARSPELFSYIGRSIFTCFLLLNAFLLEAQVYDKEKLITITNGAEIYNRENLISPESSSAKKTKIYVSKNTTIHSWNEVEIIISPPKKALRKEKQVYAVKKSPSQRKHTKVTAEKIIKKTAEVSVFPAKRHSSIYGDSKHQPNASSSNTDRLEKRVIINTELFSHTADLWLLYKKESPAVLDGYSKNTQGFGKIYKPRPPPVLGQHS